MSEHETALSNPSLFNHFWSLRKPFVASKVLKVSADYADVNYTILIFRSIDSPDTVCVNAVIKAYSISSVAHQALVFYFETLRNGFMCNSFTFPPLLVVVGRWVVLNMERSSWQAIKNGVDNVLDVQNSMVHMYGCCGVVECAEKVFGEMSKRDLVSWNSIIDAYAKLGHLVLAHRLFDAMPERNATEGRKIIHGVLIRTFLKSSLILDTALIDMYSKCERVDVARVVYDRMTKRNLVCWNAMILGHCIHGNAEDGLKLFEEMVDGIRSEDGEINLDKGIKRIEGQGLIPDEITFIGVLCACAREGLLAEGRSYYSQMINTFHIKPNFAHYWCMANLFAGVGLVQEAEEILRSMPEEDEDLSWESSFWAGLLSSCRFQGEVFLGERIATYLIESEPQNISYYRLLLNVYAVAGRWEDVARVKEMVKERGIKQMPGCNLADLKEIVHEFKLGEKWQQGMEVNTMRGELVQS
ncbi:Pentatricopeptide repeat-containing protein [Vitis vinifera]|uniref:Pentatricopeptide repeat-containing protein n=1 Tax=Vitis vinifera TaxID=29760 RepID=A0A438EVN9_VITVI|nr:Pentatricopeptide repeat-containing protein [Vitis vinifera]